MKIQKITTLFLCAIILAAGCKTVQQQKEEVRTEPVRTAVLSNTEISRVLECSATLQGYETMSISPSITGIIEHIYVEVGKRVNQGDMLVRMDQNQYNTANLNFSNLQIEMQRMEALKESGSVSQQVYDQRKLSYDQVKQSLKFLTNNTFVKAQFSGVISAKNYEDGELYAGQPILVLTRISTLKALVNISEQYFPDIKTGMKINIISEIYPDEVFPATIEIVYPTIDPNSHTFQIKVKIPNPKEKLRPGMYVKTSLSMGKANAITVPYQCVQRLTGSNERYIYINNGGVAKQVFIKLGQRFDDKVEIISDEISLGDEVVTVGAEKLVEGTKLNIIKEK